MNIEAIAQQMAQKYKEDELRWILVLKRLELNGYEIISKGRDSMKAKICDRCNSFYNIGGEEDKYRITRVSQTESRYSKSVDLCPLCQRELQQWFEKFKTKENDNEENT